MTGRDAGDVAEAVIQDLELKSGADVKVTGTRERFPETVRPPGCAGRCGRPHGRVPWRARMRSGRGGACPSVSGAPGGGGIMALAYLEHSIQDARLDLSDDYQMVFKRMQSVETDSEGKARNVGYVPYLDCKQASISFPDSGPLVANLLIEIEKGKMSCFPWFTVILPTRQC
ncbi:MAG: hypothetical protein PHQ34_05675 [Methanothrix sp.]|nr:hypothetical protein [Methanothrix sp.]